MQLDAYPVGQSVTFRIRETYVGGPKATCPKTGGGNTLCRLNRGTRVGDKGINERDTRATGKVPGADWDGPD